MNILFYSSALPELGNAQHGIFVYRRAVAQGTMHGRPTLVVPNPVLRRDGRLRRMGTYRTADLGLVPSLDVHPINYVKVPYRHRYRVVERRLRSIVEREAIDLINVHFATNADPAYRLRQEIGLPYVITAHGSDIHQLNNLPRATRKRVLTYLQGADAVLFVSRFLLRTAENLGYRPSNAHVVPNGIDETLFRFDLVRTARSQVRRVAFIGNLLPVKGADRLVDIVNYAIDLRGDLSFVIVGDGPLRGSLRQKLSAGHLGDRVTFHGRLAPDQIPEILSSCDLLIMPSRREGWPSVVLEAHACGVPVLGSSNGGIPEAINDDRFIVEDGIDFERRFAKAIARCDLSLVDSSALAQRARRYTWRSLAEQERQVFEQAMSRNDS